MSSETLHDTTPTSGSKTSPLAIVGWITAILIPIVGLIIGVILLVKKNSAGGLIIGLSLLMMVVSYFLIYGGLGG